MRAALMVLVMLATSCGADGGPGWSAPDAGTPPIDVHHDPGDITDFFGEACHSEPEPSNTVCHSGRGWCIDDVCRPMCIRDAQRCPGGVEHHADAGACYCTPQ